MANRFLRSSFAIQVQDSTEAQVLVSCFFFSFWAWNDIHAIIISHSPSPSRPSGKKRFTSPTIRHWARHDGGRITFWFCSAVGGREDGRSRRMNVNSTAPVGLVSFTTILLCPCPLERTIFINMPLSCPCYAISAIISPIHWAVLLLADVRCISSSSS